MNNSPVLTEIIVTVDEGSLNLGSPKSTSPREHHFGALPPRRALAIGYEAKELSSRLCHGNQRGRKSRQGQLGSHAAAAAAFHCATASARRSAASIGR